MPENKPSPENNSNLNEFSMFPSKKKYISPENNWTLDEFSMLRPEKN